jgi:hypothetical protein
MRRILEADPQLTVDKVSGELLREATRIAGKRKEIPVAVEEVNISIDSTKRQRRNGPKTGTRETCSMCGVAGHSVVNCWINPESKRYRPEFAAKLMENLQKSINRSSPASNMVSNH